MGLLYLNRDSTYNTRAELFSNNEQGLWLDPSQMSTLYQDSNGVTPCTAAGDPVGLILDQSRGGLANLGSEIVTNGGLSDATGWTVSGASPPSITGGQAVWSSSTGEIGWISPLTVGKWYKLEFDLVSYTSGNLNFRDGTTNTLVATTGAVAGRKTFFINATSNQIRFISFASATVTIDNISIREVPGNHAFQTTSASRPTLARIPSSGRRNLLTRTEEFDNAAWTQAGVTVSANAGTDPLGTVLADRLVETAANSEHRIQNSTTLSVTSGTVYTASIYAKAGEVTIVRVGFDDQVKLPGRAFFNLSLGTVSFTEAGSATITAVGNGWYRCTITGTCGTSHSSRLEINLVQSGTTAIYAGNTSNGLLLWGAQLETGSTATNYQKVVATTDVTESGVSDLWHLVFDGSDDSLVTNAVDFNTWTQETRRNLLVATEDFSNAFWIKTNLGVSGNTMTPDATLGQHRIYQQATHTSPHVFSVEAKANGYNFISLAYAGGLSGQSIFFDLSNGTISGSLANFTPTITPVGDGWYRCSLAYSASVASSAINHFVFIRNAASIADYSGDGVSGVLLRYPQLEQGTTLTNYQRVGTDEMTVIAGVRKLSDAASGIVAELTASASGNNGSFVLSCPSGPAAKNAFGSRGTTAVFAETSVGSTFAAPLSAVHSGIADISTPTVSYRQNAIQYVVSTDSQGTGNYSNSILYIGRRGGSSLPYNGHIYQLIVRGKTTPTGKLLEAERFVARKTGVSF